MVHDLYEFWPYGIPGGYHGILEDAIGVWASRTPMGSLGIPNGPQGLRRGDKIQLGRSLTRRREIRRPLTTG